MTTESNPAAVPDERQHSFCAPYRITQWNAAAACEMWQEARESWRILLVQSGSGALCFAGHACLATSGLVLLSGPGQDCSLQLDQDSSLGGQFIEYRCLYGDALAHGKPLELDPALVQRLVGELASLWGRPEPGSRFRVQELFAALLTELEREREAATRQTSGWLAQTLEVMETRYNEELTREQLAKAANVSPEHFSRAFRKAYGRSFNEHLTLLRIRHAQLELLLSSANLNTLAQKVGYREGLYLSRRFTKTVGVSPMVFVKRTKRFAALNVNHTASLIALGIRPELGVYTPWLEKLQSGQNIGLGAKYNFYEDSASSWYEELAAVKPDLIVHYSEAWENKRLLGLAPVLELPFRTMGWREQFRLIADAAGLGAQAVSWLETFDERLYRMNARLDMELGDRGTAVVWELCRDKAYGISASFGRGSQLLYRDIGFRPPDRMVEEGIDARGFIEASASELAAYPADHIFIVGLPEGEEGRRRVERLYRSEEWLSLEAVKRDRVYILNHPELFYGYDPLSSQAQLTELSRALIGTHHKNA
jgi:ABC-type Fe3+-hydroxamate transport system substrate-binding protein